MNKEVTYNKILNSISRAIAQHKSIEEILSLSAEMIAEFFQVELCNIYSHDKKIKKLNLIASKGFDQGLVGKLTFSTKEGLVGHVFKEQKIVQLINPHESEFYYYISDTSEEKYNSFMGFPLLSQNDCWGVLTLQCYDKKILTDSDKEIAEILAQRLSMILAKTSVDFIGEKILPSKINKLHGIATSSGIALGSVYLHKSHLFWQSINYQVSMDDEEELHRLTQAIESAKEETIKIQERATEFFVEADASIFFSQLLFLEDHVFIEKILRGIKEQKQTALSSVKTTVEKQIHLFLEKQNNQLADRVIDLQDVGIRIAKHLVEDFDEKFKINISNDPFILVVEDLLPSDLISFEIKNVLGIICRVGGVTSHAAILARSLNIPVVMGVSNIFEACEEGAKVLVNANEGIIYINPTKSFIEQHKNVNQRIDDITDTSIDKPKMIDGYTLKLQANINLSNELESLNKIYHDGIGLYRSEFMFMIHDKFPSESEQYRIYTWLANHVKKTIVIRILDIGGDKQLPYFEMNNQDASMLGWRSIRLLFDKKDVFIPHLRALLRVSQQDNVSLLFPMVAHSQDMKRISDMIDEVLQSLSHQYGYEFKRPRIGAMIEIPSAVWQIEQILENCDFVSVGTNDLLQYLFAVDRGNHKVKDYFAPMHPAILQALRHIVINCDRLDKPVSICGEMAGNPRIIPLLIGLGFSEFSMVPRLIIKIKKLTKQLSKSKCHQLVKKALTCSTSEEVEILVDNFLKDYSVEF